MIPIEYIELWRNNVAWQDIELVEHDLIISRALVRLYSNPYLAEKLMFRGGTALNKLFLNPPRRYSEDLDFVLRASEAAGPMIDAIRGALDPWLGEPRRKFTNLGFKLIYRYSASSPSYPLRCQRILMQQ